jgi:hypothetical protein
MNPRQVNLTITLEEDAFNVLVDLLANAINKVSLQQSEALRTDEKRTPRLRASRNANFAGQ